MRNENARIDKMAAWAKGVNARLDELSDSISRQYDGAAADVEEELAALYAQYSMIPPSRLSKQIEIIEAGESLALAKSRADALEDDAYLEASMDVGENGKAIYSNEAMRKAASKKIISDDAEYAALSVDIRKYERELRVAKAELAQIDDLEKEYGRRNRALVARINYATAIISRK